MESQTEKTKLLIDQQQPELQLVSSDADIKNDEENTTQKNTPHLEKKLNLFNIAAIIIGEIIGSGIFITPTQVLKHSGSFGMALIIWVIGGLIAITGGLVYIELGTLIKDSGASYVYLREGYSFGRKRPALVVLGNAISFVFIWCWSFLVYPLSMAVVTQTCGHYLCEAIAGGDTPCKISVKLIAVGVIIIVSLVNIYSLRLTAMIINILAIIKLLALGFIIVLGVWQIIKGDYTEHFTNILDGTIYHPGDIALAFYYALWAYSGWNVLNLTVEESKNNEKNLPRGLLIAMPVVIICYILVNISYYAGLSKGDLLSSPATALTFAEAIIGKAGLVIMPLLVAATTFGSAVGIAYSGPRGAFSAARDGVLPEVFCLIHNTSKTPVPAIILQVWIIAPVFMILVSSFLVVVPIALVPEDRITLGVAVVFILLGLPIFFFFAWDKFRLKIFNIISEKVTQVTIILLNTSSTRPNSENRNDKE